MFFFERSTLKLRKKIPAPFDAGIFYLSSLLSKFD